MDSDGNYSCCYQWIWSCCNLRLGPVSLECIKTPSQHWRWMTCIHFITQPELFTQMLISLSVLISLKGSEQTCSLWIQLYCTWNLVFMWLKLILIIVKMIFYPTQDHIFCVLVHFLTVVHWLVAYGEDNHWQKNALDRLRKWNTKRVCPVCDEWHYLYPSWERVLIASEWNLSVSD